MKTAQEYAERMANSECPGGEGHDARAIRRHDCRACLTFEFGDALVAAPWKQAEEIRALRASLASAEARASDLERERDEAQRLGQMIVHWAEQAHDRLRKLVSWESEIEGLSDLADETAGNLASIFDGYDFKSLRIEKRWREEIDAAIAERDTARAQLSASEAAGAATVARMQGEIDELRERLSLWEK